MKISIKNLLFMLCLIIACCGCDDLMEKDLEKQSVHILLPTDGKSMSNSTVTFWWETLDDALEYNIQIVSPSFSEIQKLWVDSLVTGNKANFSLVPGNFQWRIKALNGSSETAFSIASFEIDSTLDISSESILLLSPADGMASNNKVQTFKWNKLYNAEEYRYRITNASNVTLADHVTNEIEFSYEFLSDGLYTWSVRGQNASSNTLYSFSGIHIDTEKPGSPSLRTPSNSGTVTTDSIYFTWTRMPDSGTPLYDSLYVFGDMNLTQKILAKKIENTFYNDSLDAGKYYWHVKTCDVAGNVGEESATFSFTKN